MSGKDAFDRLDSDLTAWLRDRAPSEAPDRVLDGALQRTAREPQSRGWLGRLAASPRARLLGAAAVAAVAVGVVVIGLQITSPPPPVGESPSPIPSPSDTASPSPDPLAGCPEPPYTFVSVTGVPEEDRAACFGDKEMVITGWVLRLTEQLPPCERPVSEDLAWLSCHENQQPLAFGLVPPGPYQPIERLLWVAAYPDGPLGPIVLGQENGGPLRTNTWVEVTGHFNHPFARLCGSSDTDPVRDTCEGTFVLSSVAEFDAPWPQDALSSSECITPPLESLTRVQAAFLLTLIFQTNPADCYGSAPLTVVADSNGGGAIDGPCMFTEPAWLSCNSWIALNYFRGQVVTGSVVLASARGGGPGRVVDAVPSGGFSVFLFAAIDPESGISWEQFVTDPNEPCTTLTCLGDAQLVTGHFDDPAATSCRIGDGAPSDFYVSPEEMARSCRNIFVVTEIVGLQ